MVFSGRIATIARTPIRLASPMISASDPLAAHPTASAPRLAPDAPGPVKILVIDDHPLILEALRHVLAQLETAAPSVRCGLGGSRPPPDR